jgi:UDP-glucose 4-epimerase
MGNILVTGGAGFIGSSLVDILIEKGNTVVIFDNLSTGSMNNISRWLNEPNLTLERGDMLDKNSVADVVDKCDIVFHLAANPNIRIGASDTLIDYQQNLQATYNLLEAMRISRKCKKIIFTSSSTVYGEPKLMPTPESYSPLKPISLYGATKLACEALISGYCHTFKMSGVVLRFANVVGARSNHGIIYDFIRKLSENKSYLEILGDGKQNKSYLHIDDCVNAIMQVANLEQTFEIFNVGSTDTINVIEIARIILRELSLENVEFRFSNDFGGRGWIGDVKEMLLDVSKLKALGWTAKRNSKESVTLTAKETLRNIHVHK